MTETITFKNKNEFKEYMITNFGGLSDMSFDEWTSRELAIIFKVDTIKIAVMATIHSKVFGAYTYDTDELKRLADNVVAFKRLFGKVATVLKSDYQLTFDNLGSLYTSVEFNASQLAHPNLTQPFAIANDADKNIKVDIISKNEFEVYSTKTYKI